MSSSFGAESETKQERPSRLGFLAMRVSKDGAGLGTNERTSDDMIEKPAYFPTFNCYLNLYLAVSHHIRLLAPGPCNGNGIPLERTPQHSTPTQRSTTDLSRDHRAATSQLPGAYVIVDDGRSASSRHFILYPNTALPPK